MAGTHEARGAASPIIKAALDKLPAEPTRAGLRRQSRALPKYAGNYRDAASGLPPPSRVQNGALMLQVQGDRSFVWCRPRRTSSASSRSTPR